MSSDDKKTAAFHRIASQIVRSNPSLTHEDACRKLAKHLERAQRKKER